MGEAEAYNLGLQQSSGRYILQLDPSLELSGDIFTPLAHQPRSRPRSVITGLHGLRTDDLRHFEEKEQNEANAEMDEVEAITGSCLAFPRKLLKKIGLLRR